jgi:Domain of unknown function (DUF5667)
VIGQATAQRRANAFAQAVEPTDTRPAGEREPAEDHTAHAADRHADPQQGRLLATARALGDVPKPELDPEVKTVQRARLIAAMEAALADGSLPAAGRVPEQGGGRSGHRAGSGLRKLRPRTRWSRRLAAGGLTVGVAAGAFSGVAAASTNALPGDTLYGLKRGMEDLRLGMAGGDADRGRLLLDMASTRMQEARRLMERGRSGPLNPDSVREVRGALLGMHNEASEGHQLLSAAYRRDGSLAPIEALNAFSRTQRRTWTALRHQLPSQLYGVGAKVSSVLDAIDREVQPLQGLLRPPVGGVSSPRAGTGTQSPGSGAGSRTPSATASSPGAGEREARHGSAGPSAPTTAGQGLLGGSGLLDPPPATGSQAPSSGSGSGSGDGKPPSGVVPPLLPNLLPGLGISGGEDR